ncbi:MAG: LLM class flavin-dependent oxidoreductase [Chloroflexi bacterium]|nr:LLM class flavin-dependent oxidoreductase [Chloroflexota bacterium]MBV9133111.1 LLM class flavin-dependent oxidoreductase [Chloroflexota bacterium]
MEFGIFHEFDRLPGMSEAQAFTNAFDLVDVAERGGLDAVWLAELHFNPKRSVLASPMLLAGAIGARTSNIKIGTAVQILPLCHPLQLAEEAATVDHISHGRLIFGVGRSGFARTYAAYGVPYAESRERFAETLEIVRRAWTSDSFSFEGKYFQYHDVTVVPKPYQQPHPPVRVAATSPDTFPAIGAQGFDLFCAVRTGTLSELAPNLVAYRAAYAAADHPGKGGVFLRVPVYVASSFEKACDDTRDSIMAFYRQLGQQLEASAAEAGARAIEQRDIRGRRMQEATFDEVLREKVIVGTPEMVIQRLGAISSELGLDGILAELNCGGHVPREGVIQSLQLLCSEVMPAFARN